MNLELLGHFNFSNYKNYFISRIVPVFFRRKITLYLTLRHIDEQMINR